MLKHLVLALTLLVLAVPSAARAQDKSVTVERRDADMTIGRDGTVDVTETWVVRFEGGPFHYAFRSIPLNRVSSIEYLGVSENGTPYTEANTLQPDTYSVDYNNSEKQVTWYFPVTTNAARTFVLQYRLREPLRIYADGDQFWWKFVEADRGYPIQSSRVVVHLPAPSDPARLAGATYVNGAPAGTVRLIDGQTVQFDGGPFPDGSEWEVRLQFPHGVVTQSVQPWQAQADQAAEVQSRQAAAEMQFSFWSTLATLLILIGGGLALLLLWFLKGRDQAVALPAEFLNAPPEAPGKPGSVLPPALAGTLIDEEANVRDVLATVIDWAQRGIIRIRAVPGGAKTSDPNDDYVFERIDNHPPLQYQYERELMQRLWQGETSRSLGHIREKFTQALDSMFNSIYTELQNDGYFPARPDRVRSQFQRYGWTLLVLTFPAACAFQFFVMDAVSGDASFSWSALAPWLALTVVALCFIWLSRYMPKKTALGAAQAARWKAFQRYLEHVEQYTNVADAKTQFEKYLPYAVAFGLDKTWVEKFAAVDTPAPAWYIPPVGTSTPSTLVHPTHAASSPSPATQPTISSTSSGPGTTGAQAVQPSGGGTAHPPSLDRAASGAFTSLNAVSANFFSMLNATATSFVASNPGSSPGRGSSRSGGSSSSWHSSSSFGSSGGFSGGGGSGGGGGGGHSGFG